MKFLKLLKLARMGYPYLELAYAVFNKLKDHQNRDLLLKSLTDAVTDNRKISVLEWSRIGKALGVFKDA